MLFFTKLLRISKLTLTRTYSDGKLSAYRKYKYSCTDLGCMEREELKTFFHNIECVFSDADGVLWLNDVPITGAVKIFNCWQAEGKKCFIITNNSTRTRQSLHNKACTLGLEVEEQQILNTSYSLADYLEKIKFKKRVYIIGKEGMPLALKERGIECVFKPKDPMALSFTDFVASIELEKDIGAVAVGFDDHFSYPKLTKACIYLQQPQCLFIAASLDEWGPTPSRVVPGNGCMVKAIQTCFNKRKPYVIGKPNPEFVKPVLEKCSIKAENTILIGDRFSTDMLMGYNCGFFTLFVLTGATTLEEMHELQKTKDKELRKQMPDFFIDDLDKLREILYE